MEKHNGRTKNAKIAEYDDVIFILKKEVDGVYEGSTVPPKKWAKTGAVTFRSDTPTPPEDSDFSKFMRSTGPEKERIMLEVARGAVERQREAVDYYKHDHEHCPPQNSPCGIEGSHRCCLCEKAPPEVEAVVETWIADTFADTDIVVKQPARENLKSRLTTLIQEVREEERRRIANKFHRLWVDKFGAEVILWHKQDGETINSHQLIQEALTPDPTSNK